MGPRGQISPQYAATLNSGYTNTGTTTRTRNCRRDTEYNDEDTSSTQRYCRHLLTPDPSPTNRRSGNTTDVNTDSAREVIMGATKVFTSATTISLTSLVYVQPPHRGRGRNNRDVLRVPLPTLTRARMNKKSISRGGEVSPLPTPHELEQTSRKIEPTHAKGMAASATRRSSAGTPPAMKRAAGC